MASEIRAEVNAFLSTAVAFIPPGPLRVLDVGIDGGPEGGGNSSLFNDRPGSIYDTLDCNARCNPTIVGDICKRPVAAIYDVVILSETLEHIYDMKAALEGCWYALKPGGRLLVAVPWVYRYHPQPDYGDYWRVSGTALERLLNGVGFTVHDITMSGILTSGVAIK